MPVTRGVDATELAQGLLTKVEGVDVATARENECIHTVEQAYHGIRVLARRDDEWCASSFEHRAIVPL